MEIFTDNILRMPLIALVLTGLMCGYLGIFVILKRVVFLGAALAEVSSAGIAAALLLGLNPVIGSLAFVLGGVGIFSIRARRGVPQEAGVGIGYALAGALGVLLIHLGSGEAHMLDILTGCIIGVDVADVWLMLGVFLAIGVIHWLCFKEFIFTSFDPETAASQGIKVRLFDVIIFLTLGVAVAVSLRSVGTLVTFAFLVIPGAAALALARRMKTAILIAPIHAFIPAVLGYYLSYRFDLPTGATVTAVMIVLLLIPALLVKSKQYLPLLGASSS
ncbi:MAG: metal ABC transporter permease [Armatimonadota bacterium]|nr:metal ABC transporter permease [Armatimonadota bacterium]